jgi:hypothetical protein
MRPEAFSNHRSEILSAIRAELSKSDKPACFFVERREREGEIWKLVVELGHDSPGLDESLEGATAWWPAPTKGAADVLCVLPEQQQINLRFATTSPPGPKEKLFIYPPRYLEALRDGWSDVTWADRCLDWLHCISTANTFDASKALDATSFQGLLRTRQERAFQLTGWNVGFLWGPPGTGKTYTLGAMLARYLIQFPKARVLLLSTTNSAVDQALISVDGRLEVLGKRVPAALPLRRHCVRVGTHFIAGHYRGRDHLLPVADTGLVQKLMALEASKPSSENVQAYARWKQEIELVRKAIRQQALGVVQQARLAAMTTTRAAFTLADLKAFAPYSLIVFDEASQVSLAHAAALAPLGERTLFAGDPKQLAPIVQAETDAAKRWLGESIFSQIPSKGPCTCMLNEQSRMAEPICRIVSQLFYGGDLIVAAEARKDPQWRKQRQVAQVPPMGTREVWIERMPEDGIWSQKWHGPIRYHSAEAIRNLVDDLTQEMDASDIIVLTPFRAQRALIRSMLRGVARGKVLVSTVHRAQGSERHTVIFDPAQGANGFFQGENARRLVNVALSRAKARLVVMLSPGDRTNPLLDQVGNLIENAGTQVKATPIGELIKVKNFPHCLVGHVVQIGAKVAGRVLEVNESGEKFVVSDFATGQRKTFMTGVVVKNFG